MRKLALTIAVLMATAGLLFAGSSGVSNPVKANQQPGMVGDNTLQAKIITFNDAVVTELDSDEDRLDALDGGSSGALVVDDITANGSATDTLGFNMPVANKTNTLTVVPYNVTDNRELVFQVKSTNDVGQQTVWLSESLTFVDNTTNTEDATWVLAIPVAGADETARVTVNAAGVALAGAVGIAEGALTDSTVVSADIKNGEIVDADINASAAITLTKLGTGTLRGDIQVNSANVVDGSVSNADISATAAIALSKLATGKLPDAITVASTSITDGTVSNVDISASAAIAWSKLNTYGQVNTNALAFVDVVEQFLTSATVASMKSVLQLSNALTNESIGVSVQAYDADLADLAAGTLTMTPVAADIANGGTLTPAASVYLLNPTGWQGAVQSTNTVYLAAPGAGGVGNVLTIIVPSTATNELTIAAGATGLWATPSQLATNDCATFIGVSATKWARVSAQNN